MECSWNDGGKTKYYLVIFDQLQGHSGGLIRVLESCVRELLCKGDWAQGSPGESSEIRMRLLEGSFTLYTSLSVRVSRIRAKLVCLSITSKTG